MKRSSRLIVGLAAAAITFGSLAAFMGTDHWNYDRGYYHHNRHHHWDGCDHPHSWDGEAEQIQEEQGG